jgi:hypothetical protein
MNNKILRGTVGKPKSAESPKSPEQIKIEKGQERANLLNEAKKKDF